METRSNKARLKKEMQLSRCKQWLSDQSAEDKRRLALQSKNLNDIEFIIDTNSKRKKFRDSANDKESLPLAVDEEDVQPCNLKRRELRTVGLRLQCEWKSCLYLTEDYSQFRQHVGDHIKELYVTTEDGLETYTCLWDICGQRSPEQRVMARHVHYHAYHAKLMAIGFNARASLQLRCCKKDSTKRNRLSLFPDDFRCMWFQCTDSFVDYQELVDHVKVHVYYCPTEGAACAWGGCGVRLRKRCTLTLHLQSHTAEKLIACAHCGAHFASNRKLVEHTLRQVTAGEGEGVGEGEGGGMLRCEFCGRGWATEYLLREHVARHVNVFACAYCDMTAPTRSCLTTHVRYRHLAHLPDLRLFPCPRAPCAYRGVTKWDLQKHVKTHDKKDEKSAKDKKKDDGEESSSDGEGGEVRRAPRRQYVCHLCEEAAQGGQGGAQGEQAQAQGRRAWSRGARLTEHLMREHGAHWPGGHKRFRYQLSKDGFYRLTTTRLEFMEVSNDIIQGNNAKKPIEDIYKVKVREKAPATKHTPKIMEIILDTGDDDDEKPNEGVNNDACSALTHETLLKCDKNTTENKKKLQKNLNYVKPNIKKPKKQSKKVKALKGKKRKLTGHRVKFKSSKLVTRSRKKLNSDSSSSSESDDSSTCLKLVLSSPEQTDIEVGHSQSDMQYAHRAGENDLQEAFSAEVVNRDEENLEIVGDVNAEEEVGESGVVVKSEAAGIEVTLCETDERGNVLSCRPLERGQLVVRYV